MPAEGKAGRARTDGTAKRAPPADAWVARIRRARPEDLPAIEALERTAFQPWRQSSRASLRRSLASPRQSVWVVEAPQAPAMGSPQVRAKGASGVAQGASSTQLQEAAAGCLVLWHHPRTLRVYGIATRPDMQGKGLGRALMAHAEALASEQGLQRIVLEADASDTRLLAWYEQQGFRRARRLPDFYAPRRPAWRLEKPIG